MFSKYFVLCQESEWTHRKYDPKELKNSHLGKDPSKCSWKTLLNVNVEWTLLFSVQFPTSLLCYIWCKNGNFLNSGIKLKSKTNSLSFSHFLGSLVENNIPNIFHQEFEDIFFTLFLLRKYHYMIFTQVVWM